MCLNAFSRSSQGYKPKGISYTVRFKYKQKVALCLIMDWDTTEFNNIFKQQGTQPNVTGNTNKQIKFSQTGTTHIQSFVTGLLYKNSLGCLHDVSQCTTTGKSFFI